MPAIVFGKKAAEESKYGEATVSLLVLWLPRVFTLERRRVEIQGREQDPKRRFETSVSPPHSKSNVPCGTNDRALLERLPLFSLHAVLAHNDTSDDHVDRNAVALVCLLLASKRHRERLARRDEYGSVCFVNLETVQVGAGTAKEEWQAGIRLIPTCHRLRRPLNPPLEALHERLFRLVPGLRPELLLCAPDSIAVERLLSLEWKTHLDATNVPVAETIFRLTR